MQTRSAFSLPTLIVLMLSVAIDCAHGGLTYTTLASFAGTNGATPMGTLVEAGDGNLYGVTQSGGAAGEGTVFVFRSDGTLTTLQSFDVTNGAPHDGLVQGTNGSFYGTTGAGGAYGKGTVFKVAPGEPPSTLVSFDGTNGSSPMAALVQGPDGNFYGTTSAGGPYTNTSGQGYGTIFQVGPDGAFSNLVCFAGTNGGDAWAPLVLGEDGNLYGTGREGGAYSNFLGAVFGTAFKVGPAGALTTLASFDGTNGVGSLHGLVQGTDGNFYGTTWAGTNYDALGNSLGNIVKMTPGGVLGTLFCFNGTNGAIPRGLVQGRDGNFYGMTAYGGIGYNGSSSSGHGTIFQVTPDGTLSNLVLFTDGELPFGGLLQVSDGNLYGTTRGGGTYGDGTIFRLSVPMPPVFETVAQSDGLVALTWSVVAGQGYQVQFNTDLSSTNWNNLGGTLWATNGAMTVSDSIGPDPQRFYRVGVLP